MQLLLSTFKQRTKNIHYQTLTVCLWNTVSRTLNCKGQMFLLFIPALCHCLATSQNFPSPHKHFFLIKNVFKMDRLCTGVELSLLNIFMAGWFCRHLWKCKPLQFIHSSPENWTLQVCQSGPPTKSPFFGIKWILSDPTTPSRLCLVSLRAVLMWCTCQLPSNGKHKHSCCTVKNSSQKWKID